MRPRGCFQAIGRLLSPRRGPCHQVAALCEQGPSGKVQVEKTKPNQTPEETGLIRVWPQPLTAHVNAMGSRGNKTQLAAPGTGASC